MAALQNKPRGRSIVPHHQEGSHATPAARGPKIASAQLAHTEPGAHTLVTRATSPPLSFSQALGTLGPLLLFVDLACITWTAWLIVLNAAPNETANYLMDTETFDGGNFWLIVDAPPVVRALGLAGLIAVEIGYVYAFFKMTIWRDSGGAHQQQPSKGQTKLQEIATRLFVRFPGRWSSALVVWNDLTGFTGPNRKYWVRCA